MDADYLAAVGDALATHGVTCAPGLSATEIDVAERCYGFHFPADLRALLEHLLPVGERFPDWRSTPSRSIDERLAWPSDSLVFDVDNAHFWLPEWGAKPHDAEAARQIARDAVRAAPCLIPIYSHRYLPASPCAAGNPVFSVYQTDIIVYGHDLPSYLDNEFGVPNPYRLPAQPREIAFWSELERMNG